MRATVPVPGPFWE